MRGHIRRRGEGTWELKFDAGRDDKTGKRLTRFHSFRGTKREAQVKLAELISSISAGSYVEPTKVTVAEFVRSRVDQWEAAGNISARTAQRYRQLIENQIAPHIGTKLVQKLRPLDIEEWHTILRNSGKVRGKGGVAARTIGHAHRVLHKALNDAVQNEMVNRNVAKVKAAPKVADTEIVIVQDVPGLVAKLRGSLVYTPAMVALFTGMRIAEVLALRWSRVDLDRKVVQVREALEQTKAHGIRFKPPKSKAGRRDITLPDILAETLSKHRRGQLEFRMQLGTGRLPDDALLFADVNGEPLEPWSVSDAWGNFADAVGMPGITFHSLRHTHASQLIAKGVDVVTVSKRLSHAKPEITLRIYAHLFEKDDGTAAAAINAAMADVSC